jgi:adenine/guanine/hypoxanthine permease
MSPLSLTPEPSAAVPRTGPQAPPEPPEQLARPPAPRQRSHRRPAPPAPPRAWSTSPFAVASRTSAVLVLGCVVATRPPLRHTINQELAHGKFLPQSSPFCNLQAPLTLPPPGGPRSLANMNPQQAPRAARASYAWARPGDVNAFFGLMLDNVAVLIILFTLISSARPLEEGKFTPEFVLTRMIPGTALGVLLGDLVYTWMAFRLARRTGRSDVTAMPLGLDTPSTFGVALLVLNPTLTAQLAGGVPHDAAMVHAWHVGAVVLVLIGLFKSVVAPLGNAVRRWVPRAGLLGSLAAIALALIAFLPLLMDVAAVPLVGMLSLAVILATLVARRTLPGKFPGALAAVLAGVAVYWLCAWLGPLLGLNLLPPPEPFRDVAWRPPELFPALGWSAVWEDALQKLPIALPFALATIVGGIDCTESAAAAGDEYDTRAVLLTEGLASVAAGLCGGVIQNTPYIGHPAYKAMGGRAAYTLATGLFVGLAGYFGLFGHLFEWLPKAAMYPILIYVGLEITGQSFRATPARHYPALALAALPALAYLITVPLNMVRPEHLHGPPAQVVQTLYCLANGFIVTSLLWGAAAATLIDGHSGRAAAYMLVAGALALFGVIHSPLQTAVIDLPDAVIARLQQLPTPDAQSAALLQTPYHWAGAYLLVAGFFLLLGLTRQPPAAAGEAEGTAQVAPTAAEEGATDADTVVLPPERAR